MTASRRSAAALVLAVLGLAGPAAATAGANPARASASGACPGGSGVTVVVDFGSRTEVGCAPGDPASGFDALTGAGFSWQPVQGHPFVCQIDAFPDTSCDRYPPADAYWGYWYAERGGSWRYRNEGASSTDPDPGDVEGWAFGAGDPPDTPPPPAVTTTTRAPTTTRPPAPPPPAPSPTADAAPTATTASDDGPSADRPASTTAPGRDEVAERPGGDDPTTTSTEANSASARGGASTTTEPAGRDHPGGERTGDVEITAEDDDGGGVGPGAVAAGVGAIAVFAGATVRETRRRSGS